MKTSWADFFQFIGSKVRSLVIFDVLLGILWFISESSFVFVLQGFLFSLGVLKTEQLILPVWYPREVTYCLALFVFYGLVRTIIQFLKNYIVVFIPQSFVSLKRQNLMRHALLRDLSVSNSETITVFSELIFQAGNHVGHLSNLVNSSIAMISFASLCFYIAPRESFVGFLLLGTLFLPLKMYSHKMTDYGDQLVENWKTSSHTLLSTMKNRFFLRIYELLSFEVENGLQSIKSYEKNYKKYSFYSSIVLVAPSFAGILIISVTSLLGSLYFKTSGLVLLSWIFVFFRMAQAASQTSGTVSSYKLTRSSFDKVIRFFRDLKIDEEFENHNHASFKLGETLTEINLEVKNISFGFQRDDLIFKELSFSLRSSEVLLIKGPSGAGKSTLLRIIIGDLMPSSGIVLLNSKDILESKSLLSASIGYVGSEPFLIYGTIRSNLQYGNFNFISDEEIWNVLNNLGLKDKIDSLPLKLDYILSEEAQLSTGQKQRLSFARALLRKPKLLILDEATSNIDNTTELKILEDLKAKFKNIAWIVISHRESFDSVASKVIKFDPSSTDLKLEKDLEESY